MFETSDINSLLLTLSFLFAVSFHIGDFLVAASCIGILNIAYELTTE